MSQKLKDLLVLKLTQEMRNDGITYLGLNRIPSPNDESEFDFDKDKPLKIKLLNGESTIVYAVQTEAYGTFLCK